MINNTSAFPILSLIIFFPALGAVCILLFINKGRTEHIRWSALTVSVITFLLSLYLPWTFNADTPSFQWVEKRVWIERFGISYFVGVDGISILIILLTTLITVVCILASWRDIGEKVKVYMVLFLFLEAGTLGVFMSLDLFLFYVFWEASLVPMVFIIGVWGGRRRVYSAVKFFLYTFLGSLFMLLGLLTLYFYHGRLTGIYTFDLTVLFQHPLSPLVQNWIFLAFFLGFAVKVPMFPLHTWLPDAHTEAPTAGSIMLAAILLKMGTYGFMRFCLPLLPNASFSFAPLMIIVSITAIIYGAWVTLAQRDMKKLIAYSSVSHMGFVMLGIFVLNTEGLKGGLLQMINHGISTGALFMIVGIIYERTHRRMIDDFSGLMKMVPVYGAFCIIVFISSMGTPVTNGFIGELFIVIGAYKMHWFYSIAAVIGILFGAAYILWLFQRVFLGELRSPAKGMLEDLCLRERLTAIPFIVLIFWIGIYPKPFLKIMDASIKHLVEQVEVNTKHASAVDDVEGMKSRLAGQRIVLTRKNDGLLNVGR